MKLLLVGFVIGVGVSLVVMAELLRQAERKKLLAKQEARLRRHWKIMPSLN